MTREDNQRSAERDLESFRYKQQLKRSLSFWQLTAFGLNYLIPIDPAVVFGFILNASGGTVIIPFFLAGLMMLTTAFSYGVLIKKYPMAGSLYSYISHGLNPHLGFLAGWVFLLDYFLMPTLTSMVVAMYLQKMFPLLSYPICLGLFIGAIGLFNLFSIDLMAKFGLWMLIIGEIVIFIGFAVWSYAVEVNGVGSASLFSLQPFHFESFHTLASATAIAFLSYLGFDSISTLSEEANNPKKDIPLAMICTVVIGGITMCITGYLGMLTIPDWKNHISDESWTATVLFYVAEITGGKWFSLLYTSAFILAMTVFTIVSTAAAARLLFGMGRDNVIPKKIFGVINHRWKTPHWNILFLMIMQFVLGICFDIMDLYEYISYGALLGFILLNFTVIWIFKTENLMKSFKNILLYVFNPVFSIVVMVWVFTSLHTITLIVGTLWLIIGIVYGAYRTKGFKELPSIFIK